MGPTPARKSSGAGSYQAAYLRLRHADQTQIEQVSSKALESGVKKSTPCRRSRPQGAPQNRQSSNLNYSGVEPSKCSGLGCTVRGSDGRDLATGLVSSGRSQRKGGKSGIPCLSRVKVLSSKNQTVTPKVLNSTNQTVTPEVLNSKNQTVTPKVLNSRNQTLIPKVVSISNPPEAPGVLSSSNQPLTPEASNSRNQSVAPEVCESQTPEISDSISQPLTSKVQSSRKQYLIRKVTPQGHDAQHTCAREGTQSEESTIPEVSSSGRAELNTVFSPQIESTGPSAQVKGSDASVCFKGVGAARVEQAGDAPIVGATSTNERVPEEEVKLYLRNQEDHTLELSESHTKIHNYAESVHEPWIKERILNPRDFEEFRYLPPDGPLMLSSSRIMSDIFGRKDFSAVLDQTQREMLKCCLHDVLKVALWSRVAAPKGVLLYHSGEKLEGALHIRNTLSTRISFRVSTACGGKYKIQPRCGTLEPGQSSAVTLTTEYLTSDPFIRFDSFRIESTVNSSGEPPGSNLKNLCSFCKGRKSGKIQSGFAHLLLLLRPDDPAFLPSLRRSFEKIQREKCSAATSSLEGTYPSYAVIPPAVDNNVESTCHHTPKNLQPRGVHRFLLLLIRACTFTTGLIVFLHNASTLYSSVCVQKPSGPPLEL